MLILCPCCLSAVAANGIVYAKPAIRKSLLAKMLEELLETRVMIKQAMKTAKSDKVRVSICVTLSLSSANQHKSTPVGYSQSSGCSTAQFKVHCECHVWLHER